MSTQITAFQRIQKGIDNLISKHGTESAADIIESITFQAPNHKILLKELILKEVIVLFKINYKLLCVSNTKEYKEARKCCFYLLNKHCKMSQAQIKNEFPKFPKTTGSINGCIIRMREIIEFPKANQSLYDKYSLIEKKIEQIKQK